MRWGGLCQARHDHAGVVPLHEAMMGRQLFLHGFVRYWHAMRNLIACSLLCALAAAPVAAGETPWQEVAPGVTMRLVSSGVVKADGTSLIGLELDMPADTKTYWRVPGDTGIPTELDFTASTGVSAHQILWPYPIRDETEAYLDYAYFGPTLLPIQLAVDSDAAQIEVSVVMGVCSDICIPAQAKFSMPIAEGGKDMPNGLRIKQAVAMAPIPWDGDEAPIGDVEFRPQDNALAVLINDPSIDPASLIAAMADGDRAFGTPQKSPEPNLVLIPLLGKVADGELDSQPVQLTFITDMGAFEITRTLGGAQD